MRNAHGFVVKRYMLRDCQCVAVGLS